MSIDFTKPYAGNAPLKWDFTKPYGATGRAETKKAAPTYEEVMGAMARQGVGRPEQVLDVSDLAKSLAAGTGQVISTAGAAAEWLGAEGVARKLREIGGGISERYALEPVPWQGWRTLLDPEWYSRNVAQALPFSLLTIVPSLAVSAGTASLFGLGAFGKTVVGTLAGAATGGVLNRAMESAMEAGAAYEEALAKGMSPEKADKAADETFKKNMRLAGLDIAEIATAFLPGVKVASGVGRAALTAGRLLAAGGEEALEEMLQEKYQREALGEPFSVAAPQTQEAMATGALMGVGLGGAGEANALIGRIAQDAAERLSQKQRAEYDALVRQKVAEGKPWLTAAREAFDAMAGQREVKEAVEGATRAVIARYTAPATFAEEAAPTMMPLPTESELRGRAAEYREALRELEVGDRVRLVGDETVYTVHDLPRAWQVTVRDERGRTKTVSKDDVIADYDILRARLAETRREETAKKPATEAKKPPTQAVSLTKPAEARTEVRAAPGPSEARIAPPEAPEATVERVPATVEARATPIETAARPRVEPGQTVYRTDTGEALTVVDARDPALVTLRNARGTELKLGRRWITTEAPARAETVQDIAGELREKAEALETVPPPEYTGKTPDVLKRTVRDIEHEQGRMAKAVREKYGEEGFVERQITGIANLLAEAQAKDEVRVTDAEVEKVLTATRAATTPLEQLKRWFHQAYAAFKDIFSYEWRLEEFPRFQDQIRRFQGAQRDAQVSALETYLAIVSPMDDPKLGPKRFKLFSRLVDLRDMLEDKRAGKRVPGDLTVEQLETAEKELMAKADETVKRALENHDRVFRAAWEELQRRGKVSAEREGRRHYYPHRVLDYARDIDAKFPGLAVKLKAPYRYYLKKRGGTTRMFDTDYLTVTMTHLTKFYLDNALDDFALEVARDYDIWPRLSDSERAALGKTPVAGKLYEIDGERYFGWSYDAFHRTNHPILTEITDPLLVAEDVAARQRMAKFLSQVHVLPEAIADRIAQLRQPGVNMHTLRAIRGMQWFWKNIVLGPFGAGIPFQVMNFIGDTINLIREDPAAVLLIPRGFKVAALWQRGLVEERFEHLVDAAEQTRVVESGLMRAGSMPYDPTLRRLEPTRYVLRTLNPFEGYRRLSERRELSVRLAKLMKDLERIAKGEKVVAKTVDVDKLATAGMTPYEIAGKVAREFAVDYSKLTPEGKAVVRDLALPFSTFYIQNFTNWIAYVQRHPGEFTLKFLLPLAALAAYNGLYHGEEEDKLPPYYRVMPHLITGYRAKDGKPILIAFQTPIEQAAKMVGLDVVGDLARQVLSGKKDIGEAAKELAAHVGLAPLRQGWDMFNVFFKAPIEAAMNKNTFTGAPIVSEDIEDTPEGKRQKLNYILQQWLSPYGQYVRAARDIEPEKALGEWLKQGPADLRRAFGLREVDIERETINRFYDELERLEGAYAVWKDKREKGEDVGPFSDLARLRRLQAVARDFTDQWKVVSRVKADKTRTKEQKDAEVRNRYKAMARRAESVLKGAGK